MPTRKFNCLVTSKEVRTKPAAEGNVASPERPT